MKLAPIFAHLLLGLDELAFRQPDQLANKRFLPIEALRILPTRKRGELRGDAPALGERALLGLQVSHVFAAVAPVVPKVLPVACASSRPHAMAHFLPLCTHLTVVAPHLGSILGKLVPSLDQLGLQVRAKPLVDTRKAPLVMPGAGAAQVGQDGLERGEITAIVAELAAILRKLALVLAFLGTVRADLRKGGGGDEKSGG